MAKRKDNAVRKQNGTGNDALSLGVQRLINAVDRHFPTAFTPGLSVHTFLELKLQDTECFKTDECGAVIDEYERLDREIYEALPADKKRLVADLDGAVGARLGFEELVPVTAGLIAGLRIAGTSVEETARIVRGHLRNVVPAEREPRDRAALEHTPPAEDGVQKGLTNEEREALRGQLDKILAPYPPGRPLSNEQKAAISRKFYREVRALEALKGLPEGAQPKVIRDRNGLTKAVLIDGGRKKPKTEASNSLPPGPFAEPSDTDNDKPQI